MLGFSWGAQRHLMMLLACLVETALLMIDICKDLGMSGKSFKLSIEQLVSDWSD